MIREKVIPREALTKHGFRLRGSGEISRIEALSDGVIAFAVTLLVVSLEVPRTFTELMAMMRGFIPFAITFFMLFHVWFEQNRFFRRYGLNDNFTIWMNAALLFVVLFYIYPLKFVWNLVIFGMLGIDPGIKTAGSAAQRVEPVILREQVPTMMAIFGIGFVAVFAVFALLYLHAYRKRSELQLNELEIFDTRARIQESVLYVLIGILSIIVAYLGGPHFGGLAGLTYWLIGPVQFTHGWMMGRRRKKLEDDSAMRERAAAAT